MEVLTGRAEALRLVSQILFQVERNPTSFTEAELDWVDNYCVTAVRRILDGSLFDADLSRAEWATDNFRYGVRSVKGTLSEVMAVAIWNSCSNYDKCRLFPTDKAEQIKGTDIQFTHSSWRRNYIGQVKTTTRNHQEDVLYVNLEWFQYDNDNVHRLVMVEQSDEMVYCVDYSEFKRAIRQISASPTGAVYVSLDMISDPRLKPRIYFNKR